MKVIEVKFQIWRLGGGCDPRSVRAGRDLRGMDAALGNAALQAAETLLDSAPVAQVFAGATP
jgi:hypothetical protein